jgi:hypothetical protein
MVMLYSKSCQLGRPPNVVVQSGCIKFTLFMADLFNLLFSFTLNLDSHSLGIVINVFV